MHAICWNQSINQSMPILCIYFTSKCLRVLEIYLKLPKNLISRQHFKSYAMCGVAITFFLIIFSITAESFRIYQSSPSHRRRFQTDVFASLEQYDKVAKIKQSQVSQQLILNPFKSFGNSQVTNHSPVLFKFFQNGALSVPRSQTLTILAIEKADKNSLSTHIPDYLLWEALNWYLDNGGRIRKLVITCVKDLSTNLVAQGFEKITSVEGVDKLMDEAAIAADVVCMVADPARLVSNLETNLAKSASSLTQSENYLLNNILGRVSHDLGNAEKAIEFYTRALLADGNSSSTFRNLGSAYNAVGNKQMAFASYQQAIELNPQDASVYLKLAYFYDDFARQDWIDAEKHAESCYRYYLQQVDPEDTSVLVRLGNLLLKKNIPEKAIVEYNRALSLDDTLEAGWFNLAHAQIKLQDFDAAHRSLLSVLNINPNNLAAKQMILAVDQNEAGKVNALDSNYLTSLFDDYASEYDDHGKKMLYCAPRVIRQELGKIYKLEKLSQGEDTSSIIPSTSKPKVDGDCASYVSFMNSSLDILDLGCGTGQAGAWVKDYAKRLVGVDISPKMIEIAGKKLLYQKLHTESVEDYLTNSRETFDLVVASEVFCYLGDLSDVFSKIFSVIRKNGIFAFTVENLDAAFENYEKGYRLMPSGRFSFSKNYVSNLISKKFGSDFRILLLKEFAPRIENGKPTPGYLYIVQKK